MRSLPEQLLNSLSSLEGFNTTAFIDAHASENKITSVRLNPFKKVELDFELGQQVLWNSQGYYLKERPAFTLDPLFHAGCYYVQEAGSMFLEQALKSAVDFSQDLKVLDVCAAPGGKSTAVNSLLTPGSLLVSNEIIKSRADILAQQLSKWGTCNTIVTNNDPERFSRINNYFDVMIIDAPCSGSGLFRKQPEAIDEWSVSGVKACSVRQQKIITDVLPALKNNGIIFYSTCSYSIEENENIVEWMQKEFDLEYVKLPIDKNIGIVETEAGYRFYPHLVASEGFFCAVLRKKTSEQGLSNNRNKSEQDISKSEKEILAPFIRKGSEQLIKRNNQFHLMNHATMQFLIHSGNHLYFKKAGVTVGEIKGRDLVPNHELALSLNVNSENRNVEVDRDTALKFLRKETFSIAEKTKGFSLISYKNFGLGWAKILPKRINNYLPNEARILK